MRYRSGFFPLIALVVRVTTANRVTQSIPVHMKSNSSTGSALRREQIPDTSHKRAPLLHGLSFKTEMVPLWKQTPKTHREAPSPLALLYPPPAFHRVSSNPETRNQPTASLNNAAIPQPFFFPQNNNFLSVPCTLAI